MIEKGQWVQQEANIGRVEAIDDRFLRVRWVSRVQPFHEAKMVTVLLDDVDEIAEPRLGREGAISYSGLSAARLYQLNDRGIFGGEKRTPFWCLPSELDHYQAEPKAVNGLGVRKSERHLVAHQDDAE